MNDPTGDATRGADEFLTPGMTGPDPTLQRGAESGLPYVHGYKIISVLGGGGMGDVFHAVQLGTQREVAIKLLRGSFSGRARLRFDREVQITARLDHPNIARVFDSGVHQGFYFYAMELFAGSHLDDYVVSHQLNERQILELFRSVCLAVTHAHLRGVIHRDLKPSNILVTADGQPHLVDFGLAKRVLDEQIKADREGGDLTVDGEWAGTPAYMSPEQAAAKSDMDTRTDVYSLGVILYRLLTGEFPHELGGTAFEVISRICNEEVRRPRLAKPEMNAELESLLLRALAKSPDERYASAGELAADVKNYLDGEPLTARPATTLYFLQKRLWKYRGPLAIVAGILIALVGTAVGVTFKIVQERNLAIAADGRSRIKAAEAEAARKTAELTLAEGLVASGDLVGSAGRWSDATAYYENAYDVFKRESAWTGPADLGLWNAHRFSPPPLAEIPGNKGGVTDLAMTPDGRVAVTGSQDGSVLMWDVPAGRLLRHMGSHHGRVWSVAMAPNGKIAMTGGADGLIKIWDLSAAGPGNQSQTFGPLSGWVTVVAFSIDGSKAISVSGESESSIIAPRNDTLCVWPIHGQSMAEPTSTFSATGRVTKVVIAPDGTMLTSGAELAIWDLRSTHKIATLGSHLAGTTAICFSPDGKTICSGDTEGSIKLWEVKSGQIAFSFRAHDSPVSAVAFTDRGKTVVSADENHSLAFSDVVTGRRLRSCTGLHRPTRAVAFSADGRFGLSATSDDDTLTVWGLSAPVESISFDALPGPCEGVSFFPDGRLALCGSRDGLTLIDVATGNTLHPAGWKMGPSEGWALSPDGRRVASLVGKTLHIWNIPSLKVVTVPINRRGHQSVPMAFSPDAGLLLMAENNILSLRDARDGAELRTCNGHHDLVTAVAFSPAGDRALSGGRDTLAIVWDVASGKERTQFIGHKDGINAVAFSPDGRTAATASGNSALEMGQDDYTVRTWNTDTGSPLQKFEGHSSRVRAVAFSADGLLIASAGDDRKIELWNVASGRELRSITVEEGSIRDLSYYNSAHVLSGGGDRVPRLWDFSTTSFRRDRSPGIDAAARALRQNPPDAVALNTMGQWYAFHHVWDWAQALLERARDAGAPVASTTLAQCYWKTGHLDQAIAEFRLASQKNEVPADYAMLCIEAINADRPSVTPVVTSRSSTGETAAKKSAAGGSN